MSAPAQSAPAEALPLEPFDVTRLARPQSRIRVEGNHFVDEAGRTVIFQGVNIEDPDDLARESNWSRGLFEAILAWNANIVRVPVHPPRFRDRGTSAYFELLDQAVLWANELGLYLIIDWHSIGNLLRDRLHAPGCPRRALPRRRHRLPRSQRRILGRLVLQPQLDPDADFRLELHPQRGWHPFSIGDAPTTITVKFSWGLASRSTERRAGAFHCDAVHRAAA